MQYNLIYKTTNLINGKIYVGKHIQHNTSAFDGYLGSGLLISRAINKYGEENFTREILEICESEEMVYKIEEHWINILSATNTDIGYNILKHGGGFTSEYSKQLWDDENIRDKITVSKKQYFSIQENKEKHSERMKEISNRSEIKEAHSNFMKKYYLNEEIRTKHSEFLNEMTNRQDTKDKRSVSMKRNWENEQFRNKQTEINREINNRPEVKKLRSELAKETSKRNWENSDVKKKIINGMLEAQKRPEVKKRKSEIMTGNKYGEALKGSKHPQAKFHYIFKSPKNEIFSFDCLTEFCRFHGLNFRNMSAVANGKRKKASGGWTCISKTLREGKNGTAGN